MCDAALERGVFAQAIRPPTVPAMTARLRLAVMATHREEELIEATRTLGAVARSLGIAPRPRCPTRARAGAAAAAAPERRGLGRYDAPRTGRRRPRRAAGAPRGVFDFEAPDRSPRRQPPTRARRAAASP